MEQKYLDYARWLVNHRGHDPEEAALRAAEAFVRCEVVWDLEEMSASWVHTALAYHTAQFLRHLTEELGDDKGREKA